jgi:hypothetical protein
LFPKFNFEFKNPNIDHLHPKSKFNTENYKTLKSDEQREFYENYFNTVLNLAILSEEQNKSKNDKLLKPWVEEQEKHNKDIRNTLLIPENIDLGFDNFEEFISTRETIFKELIKTKLK